MKKKKSRAEPQKREITIGTLEDFFRTDCMELSSGYTRLIDCPEVQACINVIANMVSNMTIKLMENTDEGDMRVRDQLSRLLDIEPHPFYTRKQFIYWIVKKMLSDGNAIVFPVMKDGYIDRLTPFTGQYYFEADETKYQLIYDKKKINNDEFLHFVYNPDIKRPWIGEGLKVQLKDILTNLKQASITKKNYMTDQFKPTVIISVDALTEEFSYDEGRAKINKQFGTDTANGTPWIVPSDMIKVDTIKPLTLNDLAIDSSVQLDKKGVAMLYGVPLFYLGLAPFNRLEHNNFIDSTIKGIANILQQTFTKGLLLSPKRYWEFNPRSLYSYSLTEIGNLGSALYVKGIMTGNEVRDWMGMIPLSGLDDLVILENFIPADKIGDQGKLNPNQGEGGD